jgi:hypothetical protein
LLWLVTISHGRLAFRWALNLSAALLALAAACGPSARGDDGDNIDGGGHVGDQCTDGQTSCSGNQMLTCSNGKYVNGADCPMACDDNLGCVMCVPGTGTCNGNTSHACNADGQGYTDYDCDTAEGVTCGASGVCEGACAPQSLGSSYIGCDYYATVTGNVVLNSFDFAVAIANTSSSAATVAIDGGALTMTTTVNVPANAVVVQNLPWVPALKLCNTPDAEEPEQNDCATTGALATKGAYHIQSNQPVTVYQFNSLEYTKGSAFSYSNDASLLLPTNVWNSTYYVASYPNQFAGDGGEVAVTAAHDGTMVTVTTKAATAASGGAPAFTAGTPKTVTLNTGDVLEITNGSSGDLTGTLVSSTEPVAVLGGHVCADVPDTGTQACDHIEESMLSVDALGTHYMVNAPTVSAALTAKVEVIRIVATAAGTTLTYDPPISGASTTLANAGDFITISGNSSSFVIQADHKVLVAQYMEGQDAGGNTGDPAETIAVPIEQWRSTYSFHAPVSYTSNYIDVSAPVGDAVMLDGTQLMFNAIGSGGYALARKALTTGPNNDGSHTITGSMPFGIQVYGYGQYTSYWYPGGLDLMSIPIN